MRSRETRLIAAFYTTHDAMAFEDYCHAHGAEGRLIPLPRAISAGCGLAWSAPPGDAARLRQLLSDAGVSPQHVLELEI